MGHAVTVQEMIEALGNLDPALPVVAEVVETGELIPVDVAVRIGVADNEDVPDGDYAVLRPLEWLV